MRRNPQIVKKKKYNFYTIKPWLLWHRCDKCGVEIKKEEMWVFEVSWIRKRHGTLMVYGDGAIDTYEYCIDCYPTAESAIDYFEKEVFKQYISYR